MRLGVYIHFPYCRSLCPYCNFNSHVVARVPHGEYADAVLAELSARAPMVLGRRPVSVYFGGGTPGLWIPGEIARVLAGVEARLGPLRGCEVTAEVNPDSMDGGRLRALRDAGVNRLSVGVQSLHDRHLRALGRRHTVEEGLAVLELARQAGFWSVSADFMSGLAGQTLGEWRADLQRIAGLGFDHLSVYGLTVEPGTPLAERVACGEVVLPGDEDQADQLLETRWRLRAAGYEHYEISNYARRGHRAVHNSLYWTGGEYLGLGAGAHGFIRTGDGGVRWADVDDPREYMRRSLAGELPEESRERRTRDDLAREALMTRLRWLDGLDLDVFAMETGWDLGRTQAAAMEQLEDGGLIRVERGHLRLTERGILLLNPVTLSLLPGAEGIVLTTVSVPR